jgi:hypothetical protein
MADDSPFPPSKRGTHPNSLANLRPARAGEPGKNKTGFNGRTRAETVAKFLEETDDTDMGKALLAKVGCSGGTRIRGLLHREWLAGMGKSDLARKTLIEQYAGKARVQLEVMGEGGGPLTTVTRQETLSAEEMAQRFLRAARIAKQILDHDAALSTAPQAFSEIDVSAQELPEPSTSEAPTPHGASMGALSVGQAPTPQPGAPTTTGPNAGMIRRGS